MKIVQMNYMKDNGSYEEIYPSLTVSKSTYIGQGTVFDGFILATGIPSGSNINPSLFFICEASYNSYLPGILIFTSNSKKFSFWANERVNNVSSNFVTNIVCSFNSYYVSFRTYFSEFGGGSIQTNSVQNNTFLSYNGIGLTYPVMCII